MTPPADAVIVDFDPHIVWAIAALSIAIVALFLLLAAVAGENRK
ncbi:MAG TPA: hypothetical protein VNV39_07555 [Stellaceae bacterium]|jgi:hypothetical protein|nr:hypothetical protein [Stellaceae bacterium]